MSQLDSRSPMMAWGTRGKLWMQFPHSCPCIQVETAQTHWHMCFLLCPPELRHVLTWYFSRGVQQRAMAACALSISACREATRGGNKPCMAFWTLCSRAVAVPLQSGVSS